MKQFCFYKVGRHFVLCGIYNLPRYRVKYMIRNKVDVLQTSSTTVQLPYSVCTERKMVFVGAKTREKAIEWLKTQDWSKL